MNSLLSVDPGLSCGWAYFPEGKIYPSHTGLIKSQVKGGDFFIKLHTTVTQFAHLLVRFSPRNVAVEWPAFYSSVGGRAAAGSGSIIKLAFMVGKLAQVAEAYGSNFIPVPVNKWKGQLPKKIVEKRCHRILDIKLWNKLNPKKDTIDAIGIGLFLREVFK